MTDASPLDVVVRVVAILDQLGIDYVLGGSLAVSFFGEPRATADVDVAIIIEDAMAEAFLALASTAFYVRNEAARVAIRTSDSFNLIDTTIPFKVDIFVLGDSLLDRRQIERRVRVALPGTRAGLWVTSPEDQVLRKLDSYRAGDGVSDQQWRDIAGIIRVSGRELDLDYLTSTADSLGLGALLAKALRTAPSTSDSAEQATPVAAPASSTTLPAGVVDDTSSVIGPSLSPPVIDSDRARLEIAQAPIP